MMYALIKAGVVDNLIEWDGAGNYIPPEGFTAVEATAGTQIGATYVNGVFTNPTPPAPAPIPLAQQASAQLATIEAPGGLISRCAVRGVAVPATYTAYALALIAIVNGTDKTSTALPATPAYVAGT
ncbi:MAG: hypothetical protein KGI37_07805 [Alphaproteobacteria bacterium]|nr:hypothetical protein [Alphaproteobacteria bacterium]